MYISSRIRVCLVLLGILSASLMFFSLSTYANSGTGSTGTGDPVACEQEIHAITVLCGDPAGSEGGGASWHIFKTSCPVNSGCGPTHTTELNFLSYGGYDGEQPSKCGSDYDYYLTYGWDGVYAGGYLGVVYGPFAHGASIYITAGDYWEKPLNNTYDSWRSYTNLDNAIKRGTNVNGDRVSDSLAEQIYKNYAGSSSIPHNVGYFCYKPNTYNLVGKPITIGGKSLSSYIRDVSDRDVEKGSTASITREDHSVYVFQGWRKNKNDSTYDSTSTRYSVSNISSDTTVYAVYGEPHTFTAYHRDTSGNTIKPEHTESVKYGYTVSYTRPAIAGYTFNGWRSNGDCSGRAGSYLQYTAYPPSCDNGTRNKGYWLTDSGITYNYMNMTNDVGVIAVYTKNLYEGRSRVVEGDSWSGNTNRKSYGYNSNNGHAGTVNIQCANDNGCAATFLFDLKETHGYTASTKYCIQSNSSNNNWPTACTPLSSSGNVSGGKNVISYDSKNIKPGETLCYRMTYYHYYVSSTNNAVRQVSACAYVIPTEFQGKTVVSGSVSETAGYTDRTNPSSIGKKVDIDNCSTVTGCKVTFRHYLKRPQGIGSTRYTINRTSNLTDTDRAISAGQIKSDMFRTTAETMVSESSNLTLYPGMVVCERMTFRPNNRSGTSNIYTEICVHAHGDSQDDPGKPDEPEDPDKDPLPGNSSFINIKVRNPNVDAYKKYVREVYAKPGDVLTYRAVYKPTLQYTYFLRPERMQIDGGTTYPSSGKNETCKLGHQVPCIIGGKTRTTSLFNYYKGGNLKNWNNDFSVQRALNAGFDKSDVYLVGNYSFTEGNMALQTRSNTYTVTSNNVGSSIDERAITNLNDTTKTTPSQVRFSDNSGYNRGNVITAAASRIAYARIPYNFKNTTSVTGRDGNNDYVFAGETATINFDIKISPKRNNVTNGTYSTIVRDAKWKLEICFNNNTTCRESTEKEGNLNESGSTTDVISKKGITVNIPDVPAGINKVCFRSAVYPSDSDKSPKHETGKNWTDKEGNHLWAWSERKCLNVAKRPSMQVWGGSVYSRGKISTATSIKRMLDGYTDYVISDSSNDRYVFGSWGELGVVSAGGVTGFTSGASTGFAANNNGTLWPNYTFGNGYSGRGNNTSINSHAKTETGGSKETRVSMCNRVPLSFANTPCEGAVSPVGNSISSSSGDNDKSNIMKKFILGGEVNIGDEITITNDTPAYNYAGNKAIRVLGASNLTGGIKTIHSTNTITIAGNLVYSGSYRSIAGIPKIIIYGKNIVIDCNVSRIDAVLIADGNVKTCSSDDINARANSNQLIVNGAIIANSLTPNRTYGASSGANSIIPAEIINFDPSLYLWGGEDTNFDVGSTTNLDVTYLHELSPRY